MDHGPELARGFCLILFGFFAAFLISLSIQYTDSDLWYHLTGGRYLMEHGELYNPLAYSFMEAERAFINYFWGFQFIVFNTWSLASESGLVLLKALLLLTSGYFAARIILEGKPFSHASFLQLVVIAIIISILCARGLGLRPHLASFAFVPIFIYILGYRKQLYPMLPVLTVIWVNLHGVEYIVGAMICGSYFLQHLFDRYNEPQSADLKPLIYIALCLPAMMLNPNGIYILLTPFAHDPGLELFILELASPTLTATLDLQNGLSFNTLILVLLMFVGASFFNCLPHLRHHIAPLLIGIGALVLLTMATRFMWEWALLSTPLIAAGLRYWQGPQLNLPASAVLLALLAAIPFTYWPTMRNGLEYYPYNRESLPYGTTAFIQKNNLTGRYAIEPSYAGYAEFMLAPDIQIQMDMQFPPFTSMDIHEYNTAMFTPGGLRHYVEKYQPDLIGVKKSNSQFPVSIASELGYQAVFFDKKIVLFANRNRYPELVARHQLNTINPFAESAIAITKIGAGITELERMLQSVDTVDIKLSLVALLIEQGRPGKARIYLDELHKSAPKNLATVYYSGRVAHLSEDCETAVELYEQVIGVSGDTKAMHTYAAECYFLMGDQRNAYQHFRQAIQPYNDKTPIPLHYYQFALSAIGAGEPEEAKRLLIMIQRFAPSSDLQPAIRELLEQL